MVFKDEGNVYQPLLTEESNEHDQVKEPAHTNVDDSEGDTPSSTPPRPSPQPQLFPSKFLIWASMLALVTSALNLSMMSLISSSELPFNPLIHMSKPPAGPLRRPSTYIGLDRVPRTNNTQPPMPVKSFSDLHGIQHVVNFPISLSRVNSREPNTVYKKEYQFKLLVSDHDSAIIQWRIRDYDMERCMIGIDLPSPPTDGKFGQVDKSRYRHEIFGNPLLELYSLETESDLVELNIHTLSFNSRPRREKLIGTLQVKDGESVMSPPFHCRGGSLVSVEVACPSKGCRLRFDPDYDLVHSLTDVGPKLAFNLFQIQEP